MTQTTQTQPVIERLLRLITLLQGGAGPWGRQTLAQALNVSTKTVSRDIERLNAGGVPVAYDTVEQTYRIRTGYFLPPVDLTTTEAVALTVLAGRGNAPPDFLRNPAAIAIEKLRAGLPPALRQELANVIPAITLDPARSEPGENIKDAWFLVSKALADRRALTCRYDPIHSERPHANTPFRLDPYALHFGQRAWYVIGRRHDRPAPGLRMLKLSRFSQLQPLDIPSAPPAGWTLGTYLGNAWRMMPGDRQRHAVRLRFEPPFATTVVETQWHPTQQIDEHPDGSITAHFDIDGLDEIVWWILSYGPACTVEAPHQLRDKVAELARATAEKYAHGRDYPNTRGLPSAPKGRK